MTCVGYKLLLLFIVLFKWANNALCQKHRDKEHNYQRRASYKQSVSHHGLKTGFRNGVIHKRYKRIAIFFHNHVGKITCSTRRISFVQNLTSKLSKVFIGANGFLAIKD